MSLMSTVIKVRKTAKIKNRYNQVPHLTQDTVWGSVKHKKHHIQKSQEVSRLQGCMTQTSQYDKDKIRSDALFFDPSLVKDVDPDQNNLIWGKTVCI